MKGKYQAAFIVPIGANKTLSEDGWEFESSVRLSQVIKNYLIQSLELGFLESYLGIDAYTNDNMKMSVINDDQGCIESISFQLYGDSLIILSKVCESGWISSEAELFVPHQGQES